MKQFSCRALAFVCAFGLPAVPGCFAATINSTYSGSFPASISGTLPNQGTVLLEAFTVSQISNITAMTTSYATGGFQPNLEMFDSGGHFITAGIPSGSPDPSTGLIGDTKLTASNLSAGGYTLALTDFLLNQSFTATNLSDGFTANYGSGTTFSDANGNTRTGNYAIALAVNPASATPEPATAWLAAPLLAALGFNLKRRFSKTH